MISITEKTDAELKEIIRFARMDQTNDLAWRNRLEREKALAEHELRCRQPSEDDDEPRGRIIRHDKYGTPVFAVLGNC